jgi:2-polyprenyl-3-methyl-5-hydroxy-6-metoxy-1,4-benzoquinol methylase
VSDLGQPVLDLLAPRPGERILDVGCGDGALTARLVEAGATVVGADPAPDLVAAAVARSMRCSRTRCFTGSRTSTPRCAASIAR